MEKRPGGLGLKPSSSTCKFCDHGPQGQGVGGGRPFVILLGLSSFLEL